MVFNVFLIILALVSRLLGITWGSGFFFHPDENNMAWAIGRLSIDNLNPKFFAYGQLPLYLVFFAAKTIGLFFNQSWQTAVDFKTAVYGLRLVSALFSCLTIFVGYSLAKKLFGCKKWARIYALVLIFSPGLIQMAHFGTTESILAFVNLTLILLAIEWLSGKKRLFLISLVAAIGLGTKISSLIFFLIPVFAIILGKEKRSFAGPVITKIKSLFSFACLSVGLGLLFSPFLVLQSSQSLSTLAYESKVASGAIKVFYTRQFFNTQPIIFQLIKVFPVIMGSCVYLFFILSLALLLVFLVLGKVKLNKRLMIILSAVLPWFLFNSFLFAKWVRFMTPILPVILLLPVFMAKKLSGNKILSSFVLAAVIVSLIPGVIFIRLYLKEDIRISASDWLKQNIEPGSLIISEAGNVVNIPIGNYDFKVVNFDFYHLDEPGKKSQLDQLIPKADYFLSGSRRIFANSLRLPDKLPITYQFYDQFFSPNSDWELAKTFSVFSPFEQMFVGNDLAAEETWTVFDHPTIRLFKRK